MGQHLNLLSGSLLFDKLSSHNFLSDMLILLHHKSCLYIGKNTEFQKHHGVKSFLQGGWAGVDPVKCSFEYKAFEVDSETFPHIQTLRKLPKEELVAKVVLVRFDSTVLLQEELDESSQSVSNALFTVRYLHEAGARIILVSDWSEKINSKFCVADLLSSVLRYKVVTVKCISCEMALKMEALEKADIILLENLSNYKEEVANCSKFAELLSSAVDIFVNDSFSCSHKILASTVGVTRFGSACVAGFHLEESLCQLKNIAEVDKKPYVAIIGGRNLYKRAAALQFLASKCDGLVFVGMMSFQIMHALGLSVPPSLVEPGAFKAAQEIIQLACDRNIRILYPKDFWCTNSHFSKKMEIFPAQCILDGWVPVDLGPGSVDEINSLLTSCKKIIWIGPVKFNLSSQYSNGESKFAQLLDELSKINCEITLVGNMACKAIMMESSLPSVFDMMENAAVVWEFLKGRKLPGVMALDRAYLFKINWNAAYSNPSQPLVVDIGSGNGMFLLGMARKRKDLNFLGLEINRKVSMLSFLQLVRRCLDSVHQSGIQNGYFIATNATSTFRSIVASYPGQLLLVSVQCPNPDFNKAEHRWRMLQRSLVEAVAELLAHDGKVFLQSDIEAVAVRMKEEFLKYGKGKLTLVRCQDDARSNPGFWLEDNPFGVRSDWEQHVIDRGAPMYRLMLSKSTCVR